MTQPQSESQITSATEDVVTRKLMRELTIPLTNDELIALGKEAADTESLITKEELEFSKVKSAHKAQIDELESTMRAVLSKIRDGVRKNVVECTEIRNYSECKVQYFVDEKLVEERTMEGDELQKDLFARNQLQDQDSDVVAEHKGQELFDEAAKRTDIQDIIREETNPRTKHSATDGAIDG